MCEAMNTLDHIFISEDSLVNISTVKISVQYQLTKTLGVKSHCITFPTCQYVLVRKTNVDILEIKMYKFIRNQII